MSRTLIIIGTAIIALACGGAIFFALDLPLTAPNPQVWMPMLVSMTTVAVGAGLALRAIGRARLGAAGNVPAILSSRAVVIGETIAAAALWAFATIFAAYLVEGAYRSRSSYGLELVLGIPFGVLFPLSAGWILFAGTRLARPGNEAARLLANALIGFGLLWFAFAGVCTATGGFTDRLSLEMLQPPGSIYIALSFAFGLIFIAIGWWLRRATRTAGAGRANAA